MIKIHFLSADSRAQSLGGLGFMYQFVFNEANRQRIQTVVMIVRTDIDNGLPGKLTRPGKEDSYRSCGDCDCGDSTECR